MSQAGVRVLGAVVTALCLAAVAAWMLVWPTQASPAVLKPYYRPPAVEVVDGVNVDQAAARTVIAGMANDRRGWRTNLGHITLRIVRPGDYGTQPMPGRIGRAWPDDNLVVITSEAWTTLGPKFAAAGGTLDDQRTWIVLHEIGHLVAEDGSHKECPGSGPAPLMRATNYQIGACTMNVWPNPSPVT